ncbi:glycosyl transferase family protein [Sphingomonas morindae]|uniref:Glycosyl transferase family protein n=1 Tax=Sphingomonas morindae TaxID=1541170 RepID=A0ABY4XBE7_9SPHN|nr:glycosyl transferase family protein [Sphingomonas morindae]USI74277.1 glycosyl transferase family protein [Sphingomonas morindae]
MDAALAAAARELMLFAVVGILVAGLDDLAIDLAWLMRGLGRRRASRRRPPPATLADLAPDRPGRLVLFVPAWGEARVIGAMVATARARLRHPDWRLYIGTYPNDRPTRVAVRAAAGGDPRMRLVIGDRPGPTTKASCLNWLWRALRADEARTGRPAKAVVLHDAEDEVHGDELALFDALIERFDLVQLPVHAVPVRRRGAWARLVSGHYAGEFAEAHGKLLPIRAAMGAALPSAGTGCALRPAMLARLAGGGAGPFDADSLTEDYELGLRVRALGGRSAFVRLPARPGAPPVAVRACFPASLAAATKQKSRWIAGIALFGWTRLGWRGGPADRWMLLRDRRPPLAALILFAAYLGPLLGAIARAIGGGPAPVPPPPLIGATLALLGWRMAVRAGFTARDHGWRLALLTPVHLLIGNLVAMAASLRAIGLYLALRRTGRVRWDKTEHDFPDPDA